MNIDQKKKEIIDRFYLESEKIKNGFDYSFEVPPVSTQYWTSSDWASWIFNHGCFSFIKDGKKWLVDSIYEGEIQILTPDGQIDEIPNVKITASYFVTREDGSQYEVTRDFEPEEIFISFNNNLWSKK